MYRYIVWGCWVGGTVESKWDREGVLTQICDKVVDTGYCLGGVVWLR